MKKLLVCVILAIGMLLPSGAVFADASTQIMLNGEVCEIPPEYGRVYEEDGRTYVPIRFVSEQLHCAVNWDETDRSILILPADMMDVYALQSGSCYLFHQKLFTGEAYRIEMDVPTYYNEEECRNYIPVRFLAEAMGYTVDYDGETGMVILAKAQ